MMKEGYKKEQATARSACSCEQMAESKIHFFYNLKREMLGVTDEREQESILKQQQKTKQEAIELYKRAAEYWKRANELAGKPKAYYSHREDFCRNRSERIAKI